MESIIPPSPISTPAPRSSVGQWHTNTVVEYARHSVYVQDMTGGFMSRILVIYCGGTIGMKRDPNHGYFPVAGYLVQYLSENSSFNDREFALKMETMVDNDSEFDLSCMIEALGPILVLPRSIYGKRIAYQVLEYSPLKDSCNMSMADWIQIASDIERYYQCYDAFVVLHGTDTMAYTVSALSFLLENLGKSVIFTGSQIPFSEVRNDAKDNFLGAMTLAGHYTIPEVCLFFGNKLYRGNRVSKINTVDFEAFASPNLKPLAKLGVDIEIEWTEVLRPTEIAPFHAHKLMDPNVGCLRLFPGITEASLKAFFSGTIKGIVLETFGTGNAPDNRPEIIETIAEAVKKGVIVVNITQCPKGSVSDIYSTGHALIGAGVVSGRDMTAECALTKLSYLLSFPNYDSVTIRRLVTESIRGELTIPTIYRRSALDTKRSTSWLSSVFNATILSAAQGHRMAVDKVLRPLIMHLAASQNDIDALRDLSRHDVHIDAVDYGESTSLHAAINNSSLESVEWLLRHGANVHHRDGHGRSALANALEVFKIDRSETSQKIIQLLHRAGATLQSTSKRLIEEAINATRAGDVELLEILRSVGMREDIYDAEGRNILHYAILHDRSGTVEWLRKVVSPSTFAGLCATADILGDTPLLIVRKLKRDHLLPFLVSDASLDVDQLLKS